MHPFRPLYASAKLYMRISCTINVRCAHLFDQGSSPMQIKQTAASHMAASSLFSILFLHLLLLHIHLPSSAILLVRNHHQQTHGRKPALSANQTACNIFSGRWVFDDSYPLYHYSSCLAIDTTFNCQLFGRPDSGYQRYKWRPTNCELPRFDALFFLSNVRGKTILFVGDSLGRNQWESLLCLLTPSLSKSEIQFNRGEIFSTFKVLSYGVTISYFRTPYLVDIDVVNGKRILRLDDIRGNANAWGSADIISFNSGHWWNHRGGSQGWDYMEVGGAYYSDMDRVAAFEKGMRTWSRWVDAAVDHSKTRVFFLSISPTHDDPNGWNSPVSKNCYGETSPASWVPYPGPYTDQMKVVKSVMEDMANPPYLLDITALSELRKDGHPSIYSGNLSPVQRANPEGSADCSHWCLPGVPDTWNVLFYTALIR